MRLLGIFKSYPSTVARHSVRCERKCFFCEIELCGSRERLHGDDMTQARFLPLPNLITNVCDLRSSAFHLHPVRLIHSTYNRFRSRRIFGGVESRAIKQVEVSVIPAIKALNGFSPMNHRKESDEFRAVVVAGTFDRLHEGHKVLLEKSVSVVEAGGRLLVGISKGSLLARKSLKELIEPFEVRLESVKQFLMDMARSYGKSFDIECFEIEEAVPKRAVEDSGLDCIVVSEETETGAQMFNDSRVALGLHPLKVVVCDTVIDKLDGLKSSSTKLRQQALGTFIQGAKGGRLLESTLNYGPYMVGLTGGIASGKSYVRELLKEKGAAVLDCDALGHLSYIPGTPTYQAMVAAFGCSIVSADGTINRQTLSSLVFTDKSQMDILKKIVWAAIHSLVVEERETLAEQGIDIFVVEAALLLEAKWEKEMNEIWVVYTPEEVTRQRLMERNQISEEEANKRINSQMSSQECLAFGNVIVHNGGTKDETRAQVDKAWYHLQERVRNRLSQVGKGEDPLWFRWAGLMERLHVNEEVAFKWWQKIKNSYSEPWRHYHNFAHLRILYALYHQYSHYIADPVVVQLAMFFQHAVYHPSGLATDSNEIASAAVFDQFASEAELGDTFIEKVKAMVLYNNEVICGGNADGDLAFFMDFNLAVLGSAPEQYREYNVKIRREHKDYDDNSFSMAYKKSLRRIMNQGQVFHTEVFRLKFSSLAEINLCDDALPQKSGACV